MSLTFDSFNIMFWRSALCVEVTSCLIASYTCMPSSFVRFGKFSAIVSLNKFSVPSLLSSYLGYQDKKMFLFFLVSQIVSSFLKS